jgi:hypothetical protein
VLATSGVVAGHRSWMRKGEPSATEPGKAAQVALEGRMERRNPPIASAVGSGRTRVVSPRRLSMDHDCRVRFATPPNSWWSNHDLATGVTSSFATVHPKAFAGCVTVGRLYFFGERRSAAEIWNLLSDTSSLQPGERLRIPGQDSCLRVQRQLLNPSSNPTAL